MDRRAFLGRVVVLAGAAAIGPPLLQDRRAGGAVVGGAGPYGALAAADANGIELPAGFSSRLIATTGQPVGATGYPWHAAPDGGACFPVPGGGWVYVSNSEVGLASGGVSAVRFLPDGAIDAVYSILSGTHRNCAGGPTPWGTWLSCEENGALGRVFECDPQHPGQGLVRPLLGRFAHEAAAVDPVAGHVYLTEDDPLGRLYRFVPVAPGDLTIGTLEAAHLSGTAVTWRSVGTGGPERSGDTTAFNGGEGAWISGRTLWFTTKGDRRVWELDLDTQQLTTLFAVGTVPGAALDAVDSITVHEPSGDLFVAEDGGNLELCLIGSVGGQDVVAPFLRFVGHTTSEVTGPAFSPDGTRLYVSSQRGTDGATGATYEISGPFRTVTPPGPEVLVAAGSAWRYLDDGTDQGTAWRTRTFVDGTWAEGPAPLGYGDSTATTVGYGPNPLSKHVTTFFRRVFQATHGYDSIRLRLRRDDGAVVYVNGTEVARSNMPPTGFITSTTLATGAVGDADEATFAIYVINPRLYAGANVIAVEVHQSARNSSDLVFDLALEGTGDTGPLVPPAPALVPITLDSYVADGPAADQTYPSATPLRARRSATVGENQIAFVLVDTAGITGPIQSARLQMACRNAAPATTRVDVRAAVATWSPATLRWNNRPARSTLVGSFTVASTTLEWKEVDVTAYLNSERAAGRTRVAFGIQPPANSGLVYVNSAESAGKRPRLLLNQ